MDEARGKTKLLVDRYEKAKLARKIDKYTEEETKNAFIKPLFEALGWDFSEKDEVSAEEHIISSGRVDYGFYINGRAKFYLEAKPLRADLHREEFANQAIKYSWNKGVTWAILTDFESVKVFNAQAISKHLGDKLYFEIPYNQYLERFDQLWLLSKSSFDKDLIDTEAEKAGKKLQKIPITELLYKDLNQCRSILTSSLREWNKNVPRDLLDEGVQKLLDRLIFIRVAEDRNIEQNILIPLMNQWKILTGSNKPKLFQTMTNKFRELDKIYNSDLFTSHPFENWETDGYDLEQVIKILKGKQGYYEYDFSVLPADVLGSVYENYLGYKLSQSKKGLTLDKASGKRKEQGIYYTPTFIVDYIVKNALKPVLDKCSGISDLKKIKVLDPACGSGSFLIKALEVINEKYKEFGNVGDELTKIQILQENIYGVDLDEQAVEIARLNLLINALEQKGKLPSLDKNIKNGNSLISGTDKELEKYFGKNFRDKKPFNWKEEFPEVFKQGGFDVIIGNPPYIRPEKVDAEDRKYYFKSGYFDKFFGRFDIYVLFLERSAKILKADGILSFIIPSSFLNQNYAKILRRWFLSEFEMKNIDDLSDVKVFEGAIVQSAVIIIRKKKPSSEHAIQISKYNDLTKLSDKLSKYLVQQSKFMETSQFMIRTTLNKNSKNISNKIKQNAINLSQICYVVIGSVPHDSKTGASKDRLISNIKDKDTQVKYLEGKDIGRNRIKWRNIYLDYQPKMMHRPKFPELFENLKLLVRNISTKEGLIATYDESSYYVNDTLSICLPWIFLVKNRERGTQGTTQQVENSKKYNLFYLLGLINSKLLNFYFKEELSSNLHVYPEAIRNLPIYELNFKDESQRAIYDSITELVAKILRLNKSLYEYQENSNEWISIKAEVEKTDKKIDEEVYKLYDLAPEEIKIVENSN